ncbi:hypothetical protein EV199_4104 [Pseudobacter ginsenosidimutans]|uniref:Uncharacterized protein n=1 Tax=Pseudobacter ginsenosidimutans TaxID=661488 RepID=A0A4Q7MUD6_9BACT|nr:hypothetical protein EV199_4104 [Pseudobacter ginsenosidimutans]
MPIDANVNYGTMILALAECQQDTRMYPAGNTHSVSRFDGSNKFIKRKGSGDHGF